MDFAFAILTDYPEDNGGQHGTLHSHDGAVS
jgi:hypothetical protein